MTIKKMTSITNKSVLSQATRGLAVLAAFCFLELPCQAAVSVEQLRCEYRTAPLGLDVAKPRLSWLNTSTDRGVCQTAYQVLVASTSEILAKDQGDRWDSGKVASDQQNQIVYNGQSLNSGAACYWKVRIWDQDGKPGAWSQPASWTMGLLQPTDWQAQWIGNDEAYQIRGAVAAEDKLLSLKGVPYDGNLTKADDKGLWWEGLDPQQLYASKYPNFNAEFGQRTLVLVTNCRPDQLYFDDAKIPPDAVKACTALFADSLQKNGSIQTIVVSSDKVPKPVAVRYAWVSQYTLNTWANLFNKDGLPALPFSTDF